jgi:hypothetical protein
MKACNKKALALWSVGALPPEAQHECEAHLNHCFACREEYRALSVVADSFNKHAAALPEVDGAIRLHRSIERRVHEESSGQNSLDTGFNMQRWWLGLAVPAVAALALILLWSSNQKQPLTPQAPQVTQVTSPVSLPLGKIATPPSPSFSNYRSATRRSLDEFDRLLDEQYRRTSTPHGAVEPPLSVDSLL